MNVYVLKGSEDYFGFTDDVSGANLPAEFGPWAFQKQIDLQRDQPRISVDVNEASDEIKAKGWHVNRANITFEV
jgi:hypothetical protein